MKMASGLVAEVAGIDGDPGAADDGEDAAGLELVQDGVHADALDVHAGDADDVGAGAKVEVDWLHVFVDDRDLMTRRRQCGQQGQVDDRQDGLGAEIRQARSSSPSRMD